MPKLIIEDVAQGLSLPTAGGGSFGVGVGQAMQSTGRVGQALGQVLTEYSETDARARAVAYETELQGEANRLLLDPDIAGRGEKFEEAQRRIAEKYRPRLGGRGTYDARVGLATTEMRLKFGHETTKHAIGEARRNTELEAGHVGEKAANAESEEEAAGFFAEIDEAYEASGLFYTDAEKTEAKQRAVANSLLSMAQRNPDMAKVWRQRFDTLLSPEQARSIDAAIESEGIDLEAQTISDAILDEIGLEAPLDTLMSEARKRSSGKARSAVESRLATAKTYHDRSKAQSESNAFDAFVGETQALFEGPEPIAPTELAAARRTLRQRMVRAGVPGEAQLRVLNVFDGLASGSGGTDFDADLYADLLRDPSKVGVPSSVPGQMGTTPGELVARLGKEKASEVIKLAETIRAGGLPNMPVVNATIDGVFDEEGINSAAEQSRIRAQVLAEISAAGGVPDPTDVRRIARERTRASVDAGWFARDSAEAAQSTEIDDFAAEDPDLYRLAVWRASNSGRRMPGPEEIGAQVRSIRRAMSEAQRTMMAEDYRRFTQEQRERGRQGALLLQSAGVVDDDTLSVDDKFLEWAEEQNRRKTRGASGTW